MAPSGAALGGAVHASQEPDQVHCRLRNGSGHQIAQERRGELIRTWVEVKPPQFVGVTVEYYPPSRGRSSNLMANAPRLAKGGEAWKVAVEEVATFTDVVDWYGGL